MPTGLQIERWAPLVVGCGAGTFWIFIDGHIAADFAKELLAALLTAASIAAGFLATSLSIVLTMAASQTGKQLRNSGYDGHLHRYLREAIYGCLVLAMLSVLGFFFFDSHIFNLF